MQGPVSINAINDNNFRREPYGKSKWQAEQLLAAASKDGLEMVTLRPSVVYGPGGGQRHDPQPLPADLPGEIFHHRFGPEYHSAGFYR